MWKGTLRPQISIKENSQLYYEMQIFTRNHFIPVELSYFYIGYALSCIAQCTDFHQAQMLYIANDISSTLCTELASEFNVLFFGPCFTGWEGFTQSCLKIIPLAWWFLCLFWNSWDVLWCDSGAYLLVKYFRDSCGKLAIVWHADITGASKQCSGPWCYDWHG